MRMGILACVALVGLAGCGGHQVRTYGQAFPPTVPAEVEVLYSSPEREHIKIGSVDVRFRRIGWRSPTVYEATGDIQEAGAQLGAHAVVVISSRTPQDGTIQINGEAIRFPDRS